MQLIKPVWKLQTFKTSYIKELAKNPRQLTQKAKTDLKKSLDRFGLIDKPIVNLNGQLIGGHQRLHVLVESGVEQIECWCPDRLLTEKEQDELNIRLNKNTAEWDFDVLANQWDTDLLAEWGFSDVDLGINTDDEILAKDYDESLTDELSMKVRVSVTIEQDKSEAFMKELKDLLKSYPNAKLETKV